MKEALLFNTIMIKQIKNYPNYYIDTDGNVYSNKKSGMYKLHPSIISGYYYVGLYNGKNACKRTRISCLVLETFVSPRPAGMWALHKTPNRFNNRLNNLYWGTPKQNSIDMINHGNSLRGIKNSQTKLNELQVRIIMRTYETNKTIKKYAKNKPCTIKYLSEIFGCGKTTIYHILRGDNWVHLFH